MNFRSSVNVQETSIKTSAPQKYTSRSFIYNKRLYFVRVQLPLSLARMRLPRPRPILSRLLRAHAQSAVTICTAGEEEYKKGKFVRGALLAADPFPSLFPGPAKEESERWTNARLYSKGGRTYCRERVYIVGYTIHVCASVCERGERERL